MEQLTAQGTLRGVYSALLWAGVGLLPIGGMASWVGIWVLAGAAAAAMVVHRCAMRALYRSISVLAWVLFWALAALSLLWSPTPEDFRWQAMCALIAIPALLPVVRTPRLWLWPLSIGVGVQSLLQCAQWAGWIEGAAGQRWESYTALHWYPGNVGLWCVFGLLTALALALQERRRALKIIAVVLCVLACIGLFLTLNRATIGLGVVGAGLVVLRHFWAKPVGLRIWSRRLVIIGVTTGVAVWACSASPYLKYRMGQVRKDIERMVAPDTDQEWDRFDSSLGLRVVWWNAGWQLVQQQPLGSGSGSTRRRLMRFSMETPPQWGEAVSSFATFNPHSPWVATAIQQGVPGVVLLLVLGISGGVSGWRRGRLDPALLGLGPMWIVLAGFSVMHGVLTESYTAMLVSVLLVGSVGGLARARNDNTPDHPVEGAEGSCSN